MLAVFFPSVLAAIFVFNSKQDGGSAVWTTIAALLQPAALLIDHGHFQYNNISLGLSVSYAQDLTDQDQIWLEESKSCCLDFSKEMPPRTIAGA